MLQTVSDQAHSEAAEIINAAQLPKAGNNHLDEAEIVAGAALALEQGAPHALWETRELNAESLLKQGSREWRFFQRATANWLDQLSQGEAGFREDFKPEPRMGISFIVNDVSMQMMADRVSKAVEMPDLAHILSPAERPIYLNAKHDGSYADMISEVSRGNYDKLPEAERGEMFAAFTSPVQSEKLREAVIEQAGYIETLRVLDHKVHEREFDRKPWENHFVELKPESIKKVMAYYDEGKDDDLTKSEARMLDEFAKLRQFEQAKPVEDTRMPWMVSKQEATAAARVLQDERSADNPLSVNLARMVTDVRHQLRATDRIYENDYLREEARTDDQHVSVGNYHLVSEEAESILASELSTGDMTTPLERLRIEKTAGFVECEMSPKFEMQADRSAVSAMYAAAMVHSQRAM